MGTCDVCGKKLGFKKFRYAEGYICKECYVKASRQFTETIRTKSLEEVKELCEAQRDEEQFENFRVTGKIGNYLLVDEKDYRICVPCNRMTNRAVSDPKFYNISDIKKCSISYGNKMSFPQLDQLAKEQRSEETVSYLKVEFVQKNGKKESIDILDNPVRIKSFAFRQCLDFAKRIEAEINRLMKDEQNLVCE